MRKKSMLFPLLIFLLSFIVGCAPKEPMLSLSLSQVTDYNNLVLSEANYVALYGPNRIKPAQNFTPDNTKIMDYPANDLFEVAIENGKVVNHFKEDASTYTEGEIAFFQALANHINHPIFGKLRVFQSPDEKVYYGFFALNVNWHTPCLLIRYNLEENELVEFYQWDRVYLNDVSFQ